VDDIGRIDRFVRESIRGFLKRNPRSVDRGFHAQSEADSLRIESSSDIQWKNSGDTDEKKMVFVSQ
jgi:hypothetical protein